MSAVLDDPRISRGMREQFALRQQRLDAGAKQIGWKVGFGAPAAQEKLRIATPLIGFLVDSALLRSPASVSLRGWQKPVAEPEIAAYIGRDLPPNADRETVRSAITAIGPAIELADIDGPTDDVEAILSGDIFQRHVVLGPKDDAWAGARLDGLVGRVTRSGKVVPVPADLEANTGEIIRTIGHVADLAAALGEGLRSGQFVICGSVTAPLFLEPSDTNVEWTLDPLGDVEVQLRG